jgi:hypothetical protein
MLSRPVAALAMTAWAAFTGSAGAQDIVSAQTPSHNIFCDASPPDKESPNPVLRCDIQQTNTQPPPAPRSCPLSWGNAFVIDSTGPGHRICHGDTTKNPDDPVIAYETQWRAYGFTCTSQTSGLTCVNGQGHGFSLSRAGQKVF